VTSDFAFDEAPKVALNVTPNELAGVIEALHDGVLRRIRWTVFSDQNFERWRSLDLGTVQTVIENMVSGYTTAVMTYRDAGFKNRAAFETAFLWPDEIFEIISGILQAESWDEVEKHPVHSPESCKVCCTIFGN